MGERNRQITIPLSNAEWAKLDDLAGKRGWSRSALIRHLLNREHEASKHATPLECDAALGEALKKKVEDHD
jgi:hypothetical protein